MRTVLVSLAAAFTIVAVGAHGQTKDAPTPSAAVRPPLERFRGPVGLQTARGRMRSDVRILEWIVDGRRKIDRLPIPARGLNIFLVRSGGMTTIIDGKRERRPEGANFTVPPGVPVGIETGDDVAGFDLIVIEEPKQP